jgi:hypothetical protein
MHLFMGACEFLAEADGQDPGSTFAFGTFFVLAEEVCICGGLIGEVPGCSSVDLFQRQKLEILADIPANRANARKFFGRSGVGGAPFGRAVACGGGVARKGSGARGASDRHRRFLGAIGGFSVRFLHLGFSTPGKRWSAGGGGFLGVNGFEISEK